MLEIEWNSDSSVLLVLIKIGFEHELQFWTQGNYHWYLKQNVRLPGSILQPHWHQEDPALLQCLYRTGAGDMELHGYRLAWETDTSGGLEESDLGVVAVVDGAVVKVTPFRQAVVPPPQSAFEIHVDGQVKQVSFAGAVTQGQDMGNVFRDRTGYAPETLFKDARFRLGLALREAGVHGSKAAMSMVAAQCPREQAPW